MTLIATSARSTNSSVGKITLSWLIERSFEKKGTDTEVRSSSHGPIAFYKLRDDHGSSNLDLVKR